MSTTPWATGRGALGRLLAGRRTDVPCEIVYRCTASGTSCETMPTHPILSKAEQSRAGER